MKQMESLKTEGNNYFKVRNWGLALEKYTEALKIDPLNDHLNKALYSNRAAALSGLGRYREALLDCNKALSIDPEYLRCICRRADIHMKLEKYEEAVQDYQKALEIEPKNKDTKRLLNEAKLDLKRSKRKDYYKILGVNRNFTKAELKKAYYNAAKQWHPGNYMVFLSLLFL